MSIDRGLHGGKQLPPSNQNLDFSRYRSMDDLGGKDKSSGIELVKLLRVSKIL